MDPTMIRNALQTNLHESLDLLSLSMVLYFVFLGLLPAFIIYKFKVEYRSFREEFFAKVKTIILSLFTILILLLSFSQFYASFFREHMSLRFYTNPTFWIYSIGDYISKTVNSGPIVVKPLGEDAKIERSSAKRKIVIVVVGEATRADRFSLNGYKRETNPLLEKENVIDLSNVSSCGTSTAYSVPCMFSVFNRSNYSYKKAISHENVLDVLKHTKGVAILWRDNNSDSKGVALRAEYQDFKISKNNPHCDGECRDIGMLNGLDKYIAKHKDKDILIVLHQMGNHGPAYYKRYPKEFEKFTPVCKTNQLEECTKEEINNAYDNGVLYTDYFLSHVIDFLKSYDKVDDTAMIYMSDHGESLGENGIYLHGMPYFVAPVAQTHIASIIWLGKGMSKLLHRKDLERRSSQKYSQDNLFHSLLGAFEVNSSVYNKKLDIFKE